MTQPTVAVVINTKGRPGVVADIVKRVQTQTRAPDHIFVVGAHPLDLAALDHDDAQLSCLISRKGRAGRLNEALDMVGSGYDHVIFFDDDYLPSRFWIERAAQLFAASPEFVAIAGENIIQHTDSHGVSLSEAQSILQWCDGLETTSQAISPRGSSYLGNIAIRGAALDKIRLDESLPFGSSLADVDFCAKISQRGRIGRAEQLNGVKIDAKTQRENGRKAGFAQIANAAYLARKGSFSRGLTFKLMTRSLAANALHSVRPEPHIDRRGRLLGNLQAFATLLHGANFLPVNADSSKGAAFPHS